MPIAYADVVALWRTHLGDDRPPAGQSQQQIGKRAQDDEGRRRGTSADANGNGDSVVGEARGCGRCGCGSHECGVSSLWFRGVRRMPEMGRPTDAVRNNAPGEVHNAKRRRCCAAAIMRNRCAADLVARRELVRNMQAEETTMLVSTCCTSTATWCANEVLLPQGAERDDLLQIGMIGLWI